MSKNVRRFEVFLRYRDYFYECIMDIKNITFKGPPVDDWETYRRLPTNYRNLLKGINGFIQFNGGFHLRGACIAPNWHALATVWTGELSLSKLFSEIEPSDIPFGQDCFGDQYFLRKKIVHRLHGEDGTIETVKCGLFEFLENIQNNPIQYLRLQPLLMFARNGEKLEPGQLLNAYPPFCTKESGSGVSLKAVPYDEQIRYLAQLSTFLGNIPDGGQLKVTTKKAPIKRL